MVGGCQGELAGMNSNIKTNDDIYNVLDAICVAPEYIQNTDLDNSWFDIHPLTEIDVDDYISSMSLELTNEQVAYLEAESAYFSELQQQQQIDQSLYFEINCVDFSNNVKKSRKEEDIRYFMRGRAMSDRPRHIFNKYNVTKYKNKKGKIGAKIRKGATSNSVIQTNVNDLHVKFYTLYNENIDDLFGSGLEVNDYKYSVDFLCAKNRVPNDDIFKFITESEKEYPSSCRTDMHKRCGYLLDVLIPKNIFPNSEQLLKFACQWQSKLLKQEGCEYLPIYSWLYEKGKGLYLRTYIADREYGFNVNPKKNFYQTNIYYDPSTGKTSKRKTKKYTELLHKKGDIDNTKKKLPAPNKSKIFKGTDFPVMMAAIDNLYQSLLIDFDFGYSNKDKKINPNEQLSFEDRKDNANKLVFAPYLHKTNDNVYYAEQKSVINRVQNFISSLLKLNFKTYSVGVNNTKVFGPNVDQSKRNKIICDLFEKYKDIFKQHKYTVNEKKHSLFGKDSKDNAYNLLNIFKEELTARFNQIGLKAVLSF